MQWKHFKSLTTNCITVKSNNNGEEYCEVYYAQSSQHTLKHKHHIPGLYSIRMDGWLGLNGIFSTQAISCPRLYSTKHT